MIAFVDALYVEFTYHIQDDQQKSGVISHPIKSVFFVQIQNFGFSKYSLGDARC